MTALMRRNPFDELQSLFPRDLFSRFGGSQLALEWSPRCDVSETDSEIVVNAELPGVAATDMDVSIHDGVLTVRGEKRSERNEEEEGRAYSERFFGSFQRSISLPSNVDEEKIEASLKDGILCVRLPKATPAPPPEARKVEIKTA
jgi:HSP20 family protein